MDNVEILAQFSDALNKYGAESAEVRAYCKKYAEDAELSRLFRTAVKVQAKLRSGSLKSVAGDADAAKSAARALRSEPAVKSATR